MPTEEIMACIRTCLDQWIQTKNDIWIALYRLLLDYIYEVPRITDSNRLKAGIWRERAKLVEAALAKELKYDASQVCQCLDTCMNKLYPPGTQRMNPVGIAFACSIVHLIDRFAGSKYTWKLEAEIGKDVFPNLKGFRRKRVDIVVFKNDNLYAVISSKWGMRHDRLRDPLEEADTYKKEVPSLKFFLVTNEFDHARLMKILTYPTIDGVFHINRDMVCKIYKGSTVQNLEKLRDIVELFDMFP